MREIKVASFKQKLEKLFTDPASGIANPVFEIIEEPSTHKLAGFIISKSFENMDHIDRQNKIWVYMEKFLDQEELNKAIRLQTITPDEADFESFYLPSKSLRI